MTARRELDATSPSKSNEYQVGSLENLLDPPAPPVVGRCMLTLDRAWFQHLNLACDVTRSKFAFNFNFAAV